MSGDWRSEARCLDEDPELFFVHDSELLEVENAKRVCLGCPAKATCLAEAIERNEAGIWGGTTEAERRSVVRRRRYERQKARASVCRRGHDLTLPNAYYVEVNRKNDMVREVRRCRECDRAADRRRAERKLHGVAP